MPATRDDLASVRLGACRPGVRRLAEDARVIDRLAGLGDEGMNSGVDDTFDIDALVEDAKVSSKRSRHRA